MKKFDPKKHDFLPGGEEKTKEAERAAEREAEHLDEALEESFPASDPPSVTKPKESEPDEGRQPKKKKREGQ